MPKATFYTHVGNPAAFTCRLAGRAVQSGSRVLVWSDAEETLARLDADLWRFDPESFLPHEIWYPGSPFPPHTPLLLAAGTHLPDIGEGWAVLNLSPDFWSQAPTLPARVLEIVSDNLEDLAEARERFKAYRQHSFEIEHHNMQGKA
ncbi:DNA polymerase III subunit chi [Uruburuella testudinis]|uniref:DNA polymerase III subunit chi n=1 Tax=Uruburuella testudinis TaxID=1282863 RepID=A0ABY4DRP6_9NEIS|nr:DNA polymerase III subunit chi [Uruburuella testudinis]UOO81566.1 DNA polymerase III subunit chi [Uruburuella testudinis]